MVIMIIIIIIIIIIVIIITEPLSLGFVRLILKFFIDFEINTRKSPYLLLKY